jgi:hypothetical protein
MGLRQRVRDRGARRRAAGRPQFAAARAVWTLCRAAFRHRVHRPPACEPALVAVPDPPSTAARRVRAVSATVARDSAVRHADVAEPGALGSVSDSRCRDRFHRRAGDDRRQRQRRRADRHRYSRLRVQPSDVRSLFLRRRRRAADRAPGGRAADRDGARDPRRRTGRHRADTARHPLLRRVGGLRGVTSARITAR